MAVEIVAAQPADAAHLGRICYDAFRVVQERHGLPPDWASPAAAEQALGLLIADPAVVAVMSIDAGHVVGSNFLSHHDGWGGIGPLSVAPRWQGRGIGRTLMTAVMAAAKERELPQLRLQQDAANMASLALYASLEFVPQETTVVMEARPTGQRSPGIRAATVADLDEIARLSQRQLRLSRRQEVAAALDHAFTVLVQEAPGGLSGYFIAGRRGHGVATEETSMLALIHEAAYVVAPAPMRFFCPLREASLLRALLATGCRATKMMTLMTRGPYAVPDPVWLPSVLG